MENQSHEDKRSHTPERVKRRATKETSPRYEGVSCNERSGLTACRLKWPVEGTSFESHSSRPVSYAAHAL